MNRSSSAPGPLGRKLAHSAASTGQLAKRSLLEGKLFVAQSSDDVSNTKWQPFHAVHHMDGSVSFSAISTAATTSASGKPSRQGTPSKEFFLDADWREPFLAAPWRALPQEVGAIFPFTLSYARTREAGEGASSPKRRTAVLAATDARQRGKWMASFAQKSGSPELRHGATASASSMAPPSYRRVRALGEEHLAVAAPPAQGSKLRLTSGASGAKSSSSSMLRDLYDGYAADPLTSVATQGDKGPRVSCSSDSSRSAMDKDMVLAKPSAVPVAGPSGFFDVPDVPLAGPAGFFDVPDAEPEDDLSTGSADLFDVTAAGPAGFFDIPDDVPSAALAAPATKSEGRRAFLKKYVERQAEIEQHLQNKCQSAARPSSVPRPPRVRADGCVPLARSQGRRTEETTLSPIASAIEPATDMSLLAGQHACPFKISMKTDNVEVNGETLVARDWSGGVIFFPPASNSFRLSVVPLDPLDTHPFFIGVVPGNADLNIPNFFGSGGVFLCMGGGASTSLISALGAPGGPAFHSLGERQQAPLPNPSRGRAVSVQYSEEKLSPEEGGGRAGRARFLVEGARSDYHSTPKLKAKMPVGVWRPCILLCQPGTRIRLKNLI